VGGAGVLVVLSGAVVDAAAVLHALQLLVALVELVVAHRRDVEAEVVHRLDGRLVVEGRRQERRGADDVPGGHREGVRMTFTSLLQVSGQVLDPSGVDGVRGDGERAVRVLHLSVAVGDDDLPRGPARRLEVSVEVVERQELDVHGRPVAGRLGRTARGGHARAQAPTAKAPIRRRFDAADMVLPS